MRTLVLISFATSFLAVGSPSALASSAYTCETFSYGSSTARTAATGINNEGQVVGSYAEPGSRIAHAFLRDSDGTMTPLTSPAGDDNFSPLGINNLGQVLGDSFILNPDGSFITIDQPQAPPGHVYLPYVLSGLNDNGEVGGSFMRYFDNTGTGTLDFFIREPDGTYTIIDEIRTGGTNPAARPGPLNNSGFLLEQLRFGDAYLIHTNGVKIPLSYAGFPTVNPGPGGPSFTTALNNNNVTAGFALTPLTISFLHTPDGQFPSVDCGDRIFGLNDYNV